MTMWEGIKAHPIRFFALLCVAVTSVFLMIMADRLINVLSSPDWCSKALQAERISPGKDFSGLTACVDLLKIQLQSLSVDSHMTLGTFAFALLVLVVIVIAGGKVDLEAGKEGLKAHIARENDKSDTLNAAGDALKEKAKEESQ